uniref:Outer capsid protein VP4 n=1 Tax=Rotavirus B (isolate RVB/Human/China/ADRV/1982) TaxID=10942 RepID=D6NGF7_ROTGA|nr:structural protein VP4 [Human rotavirus B]
MLTYLRREWQSFGETVTIKNTFNAQEDDSQSTRKDDDRPVKTKDRYCYKAELNRSKYYHDVQGFSLGQSDLHIDPTQFIMYSGTISNGISYVNQAPSCGTVLSLKFTPGNSSLIENLHIEPYKVEVLKIEHVGNVSRATLLSDIVSLSIAQKKLLLYGFTKLGVQGLTGDVVSVETKRIPTPTQTNLLTIEDSMQCFAWDMNCANARSTNQDSRLIIYEQEDGFWKIVTETLSIKLKPYFKAYGTMGGAFKNWLVDSGFEKYQYDYVYMRDGMTVNAHTITYVNPSGKAGLQQDWRPATDYNGQITVLQPGDGFSVWYYEDKWQINQAIYAKNFQSDTQAQGCLENFGPLKFKMNYIPAFAEIRNKPGKVNYAYLNGGFAQVDASGYTGMAIILNFVCTGEKFYASDNNTRVDDKITPFISYIGDYYTLSGGDFYRQGCCAGFAAGYDDVSPEHDITVSYTVMKPSDPDFVTGGENYGESITSDLEVSIRNLQDQINSIIAEMNIQQVTSAVFTAITNLGELPGLFSNITKVFSKTKEALSKLKSRKKTSPMPIAATSIIDKTTVDVPNLTIVNKMPEEYELGIIYNSMRTKKLIEQKRHDFSTFTIATEVKLPYISKATNFSDQFMTSINSRGITIGKSDIIQYDPMHNIFSAMNRKNAHIINYKIDPDLAHEVLSQMSTNSTRSLFSLNVRKQLHVNNSFDTPTYGQLVERILDDGQLLDILGKLNPNSVEELFGEFLHRIQHQLREY